MGGGAEPAELTQLAEDLAAEPPQVAAASGTPPLPRQVGVVAVLVEPRATLVGELEPFAPAVVDRADEPLVLELGEQGIDGTRARAPAASAALLELGDQLVAVHRAFGQEPEQAAPDRAAPGAVARRSVAGPPVFVHVAHSASSHGRCPFFVVVIIMIYRYIDDDNPALQLPTSTVAAMVSSRASTVDEYLAELPQERADVVRTVRRTILERLPDGFVETMNWGMICYELPLSSYPDTYNGQPLGTAALAAQVRHYSLYLYGVYMSPELTQRLRDAYAASGKKLDMGKSCVRFRNLDGIDLDAVGEVIAAVSPEDLIAMYETSGRGRGKRPT